MPRSAAKDPPQKLNILSMIRSEAPPGTAGNLSLHDAATSTTMRELQLRHLHGNLQSEPCAPVVHNNGHDKHDLHNETSITLSKTNWGFSMVSEIMWISLCVTTGMSTTCNALQIGASATLSTQLGSYYGLLNSQDHGTSLGATTGMSTCTTCIIGALTTGRSRPAYIMTSASSRPLPPPSPSHLPRVPAETGKGGTAARIVDLVVRHRHHSERGSPGSHVADRDCRLRPGNLRQRCRPHPRWRLLLSPWGVVLLVHLRGCRLSPWGEVRLRPCIGTHAVRCDARLQPRQRRCSAQSAR